MDFGSLVSLNNKPATKEGWENTRKDYPLSGCRWLETEGTFEVQEKKQKIVFPTKDASIVVVLHENHKIYYSSEEKEYRPFILPPTEDNIRHFVQAYFREKYSLELSVRPVHDKYFENDAPFVTCNAQVQKGHPNFPQYKKEN